MGLLFFEGKFKALTFRQLVVITKIRFTSYRISCYRSNLRVTNLVYIGAVLCRWSSCSGRYFCGNVISSSDTESPQTNVTLYFRDKLKVTPEQSMKAQMGSSDIALLFFFNHFATWGTGDQRHNPASLPPVNRPGTRFTAGSLGPKSCPDGCGKSRPPPTGIRFPARPVHTIKSRYIEWITPAHYVYDIWCKVSELAFSGYSVAVRMSSYEPSVFRHELELRYNWTFLAIARIVQFRNH